MRPHLLPAAVGALLLASPALAQRPTSRPKVTPSAPAPAQPAPTTIAPAPGSTGPLAGSSTMGYLQGVAIDSLHGEPLVGALISSRARPASASPIRSAGSSSTASRRELHRVLVDHPMLDTLGISSSRRRCTFGANKVTRA